MLKKNLRVPLGQSKSLKPYKTLRGKYLSIKITPNQLILNRFGVIISLKFSKSAVIRNNFKRKLIRLFEKYQKNLPLGFDYIVILKPLLLPLSQTQYDIIKELKTFFEFKSKNK